MLTYWLFSQYSFKRLRKTVSCISRWPSFVIIEVICDDFPLSGFYEGQSTTEEIEKGSLELKIDVDQLKQHSPILKIISGSVKKLSKKFLKYVLVWSNNWRLLLKNDNLNHLH